MAWADGRQQDQEGPDEGSADGSNWASALNVLKENLSSKFTARRPILNDFFETSLQASECITNPDDEKKKN